MARMNVSETLIEAAFVLAIGNPSAWDAFAKAYAEHAMKECVAAVRATPESAELARGGAQFALKQAEAFTDIHEIHARAQEARRKMAQRA